MPRRIVTIALCLLAAGAAASAAAASGDEFKIIKLEQDVRDLERQVETLTRELAELRARLARGGEHPPRPDAALRGASPKTQEQDWLSAANWDRVRVGMSELEVISLLGPPVSMRVEDDARVLLYAMEIGAGGFLSGSVKIGRRQVVEVERPVLK